MQQKEFPTNRRTVANMIKFKEIRLEGGVLSIRPERDSLGEAMAVVRKHKENRLYDCEIKEHREKRSLDANAYMWVLLGELSKVMRIPPDDLYRGYVLNLGGNYLVGAYANEDVPKIIRMWEHNGDGWMAKDMGPAGKDGESNIRFYYGSSVYDTATMSRLIDNVVQDCKAVGVETLTPEKLSLLKEGWVG